MSRSGIFGQNEVVAFGRADGIVSGLQPEQAHQGKPAIGCAKTSLAMFLPRADGVGIVGSRKQTC